MADDGALRDRLAVDRTMLANERTLLAYLRTGIAFLAAGGSSVHFLRSAAYDALGWFLVAVGVATMAVGAYRYRSVRRRLLSGR